MKKFLILFLSIAALVSCSSDDDDSSGDDPIIGTWILVDASFFNVDECEQESMITFNQNNTGSGTFYFGGNAGCEPQTSSGDWENLGDSRYILAVPVVGNLTGTANFTDADNFVFTTTSMGSFTFQRQ